MLHKLSYIILIFVCLFSISAYSQNNQKASIEGRIVFDTDEPAGFASVVLKDTRWGTLSAENGYFRLTAPSGSYTMCINSIFAKPKELAVELREGEMKNLGVIKVEESKHLLNELVVTGQSTPQTLKSSVYKIRVLDADKIAAKGAVDVISLLTTEAGFSQKKDLLMGETDVQLMGMRGYGVKILIDGSPIIDQSERKQSLSQIDVNTIERIEIVEGPMSVAYGSDALAGVINIITKKEIKEKPSFLLSMHEESAGREYKPFYSDGIHNESFSFNWGHETGFYSRANFSRIAQGGWVGDKIGREKKWFPKSQFIYGLQVGYKKKTFNINYTFNYLDEKISYLMNPQGNIGYLYTDKYYYVDRFSHRLISTWRPASSLRLKFESSYQDYVRSTCTVINNDKKGIRRLDPSPTAQDVSYLKSFHSKFSAFWTYTPRLSVNSGIEFQRESAEGDRILGKHLRTDCALFVSTELKPFDFLSLTAGVRKILYSQYKAPFAIPSVQTNFTLNEKMNLRFSYAQGFRTPKVRELFFVFQNSNHNFRGNENLKPEYSQSFQSSWVWNPVDNNSLRSSVSVSGFYNYFESLIDLVLVKDSPIPNTRTYHNFAEYAVTGGTVEASVSTEKFSSNIAFMLIGRSNPYATGVKRIARSIFSSELSLNLTYKLSKKTDMNLFYKYAGKSNEYFINLNSKDLELGDISGYNWADLSLTHRFNKAFSIVGGVKNIFNVISVTNTANQGNPHSGGDSSLLGCGRSYFVGLNYIF